MADDQKFGHSRSPELGCQTCTSRAIFAIDTIDQPGRWYLKFIHMARLEGSPDIDYESKWATLTFAVR